MPVASLFGILSSPSFPRSGVRAGEAVEVVWCLGWTGEAVAVVKLGPFVLGLLLRFARASSGTSGEVSRGLYRSLWFVSSWRVLLFSGGAGGTEVAWLRWLVLGSGAGQLVVSRWRIWRGWAILVAVGVEFGGGDGLAVFVQLSRSRCSATGGSCGFRHEMESSLFQGERWSGFFFGGFVGDEGRLAIWRFSSVYLCCCAWFEFGCTKLRLEGAVGVVAEVVMWFEVVRSGCSEPDRKRFELGVCRRPMFFQCVADPLLRNWWLLRLVKAFWRGVPPLSGFVIDGVFFAGVRAGGVLGRWREVED